MLKPPVLFKPMVVLPVEPSFTVIELGIAVGEKSAEGFTVTFVVPVTEPLVAVTANGPPVVEGVNKPVDEPIVPPPDTDQANVGCVAKLFPY